MRCGISRKAFQAFQKLLEEKPEVPVGLFLVIENRDISSEIARRLDIAHASPQAILVRDGAIAWEATHWDITTTALTRAWSNE